MTAPARVASAVVVEDPSARLVTVAIGGFTPRFPRASRSLHQSAKSFTTQSPTLAATANARDRHRVKLLPPELRGRPGIGLTDNDSRPHIAYSANPRNNAAVLRRGCLPRWLRLTFGVPPVAVSLAECADRKRDHRLPSGSLRQTLCYQKTPAQLACSH